MNCDPQILTAIDKASLVGDQELVAVQINIRRRGEYLSECVAPLISTLEYISKCFKETVVSPVSPVALVTSNHFKCRAISMACSMTA